MDPDLAESANCWSGLRPKAYQEFNASLAEKLDADRHCDTEIWR